jgi:AraC-like DNA-binding protein
MAPYRTIITTTHVPPGDRLSFWRETVSDQIMPVEVRTHTDDFKAQITNVPLGTTGAQVSHFRYPPFDARRTPRMIRRADPECLLVAVLLDGENLIEQHRQSIAQEPLDLAVYDSSHPFRVDTVVGATGPGTGLMAVLPRGLVTASLPAWRIHDLVATKLPTHTGIGALVRGYLAELVRHADDYTPADRERLAAITLDLILAALAHRLDPDRGGLSRHRHALRARLEAFIRQHLSDPDLTPNVIAAALNTSRSELYRLFNDQDHGHHGLGLADWIKQQRMARCERELADPTNTSPIAAIAARWGINSPSYFSREFRALYGESPREYRTRARLSQPDPESAEPGE